MKVIFITGYWKSGTTLLQFLLAKDRQIQNIFPREDINYDGSQFWKRYIPQNTSNNGHYIPDRIVKIIDTDTIRGWFNKFYDGSEYILLKRPQFVMNQSLIRELWPHTYFIAIKRDLLPNIYSMLRMRKLNNYQDSEMIGQYLPRWKKMKDKSPIERLVYQYCYVNNYIDKHYDFTVKYDKLCGDTENVIRSIGNYIGHDINIDIPNITNCDVDYMNGTILRSRNDTTIKGKLSIETKGKEFPPLTKEEIDTILSYYDKYKNIEVI